MAAAFADMMACMVVANWFCLLNVYVNNLCFSFLLLLFCNYLLQGVIVLLLQAMDISLKVQS